MRVSPSMIERRGMTVIPSHIAELSIERPYLSMRWFTPWPSLDSRGGPCRICAVVGGRQTTTASCQTASFAIQVCALIKDAIAGRNDYLINIADSDVTEWIDSQAYIEKPPNPTDTFRAYATHIIKGVDLLLFYSETKHVRGTDVSLFWKEYRGVRRYAYLVELFGGAAFSEAERKRLEKLRAKAINTFARYAEVMDITDPVPGSNWTITRRVMEFLHLPVPEDASKPSD